MIESQAPDEVQIRQVFDDFEVALRDRDSDKMMSLYAPDVVTFDLVPPLQYAGTNAYEKSFRRMFDAFAGPIAFETRNERLYIGADVAFSHSLIRTHGTMKGGRELDRWLRRTVCLRRINGKWLMAHEHISLPMNPESGSAVGDLQP